MNSDETTAKELRQAQVTDTILDGPREVAGYKLRPFAFGTNTQVRKMGLTMFYMPEDELKEMGGLSDDEQLRQLVSFFWLQSEPIETVLRCINSGKWSEAIEFFEMGIPLHHTAEIMAEVRRISLLAASNAVEVHPRENSTEEGAPGN
jgi:hypothetical protein